VWAGATITGDGRNCIDSGCTSMLNTMHTKVVAFQLGSDIAVKVLVVMFWFFLASVLLNFRADLA